MQVRWCTFARSSFSLSPCFLVETAGVVSEKGKKISVDSLNDKLIVCFSVSLLTHPLRPHKKIFPQDLPLFFPFPNEIVLHPHYLCKCDTKKLFFHATHKYMFKAHSAPSEKMRKHVMVMIMATSGVASHLFHENQSWKSHVGSFYFILLPFSKLFPSFPFSEKCVIFCLLFSIKHDYHKECIQPGMEKY